MNEEKIHNTSVIWYVSFASKKDPLFRENPLVQDSVEKILRENPGNPIIEKFYDIFWQESSTNEDVIKSIQSLYNYF
ncbi:MAG: hypothetical protein HGA87_01380 [Desulfobulbaceae bacterium]|nr:hypothetical protein [Desulfobulbaceae bacterium]